MIKKNWDRLYKILLLVCLLNAVSYSLTLLIFGVLAPEVSFFEGSPATAAISDLPPTQDLKPLLAFFLRPVIWVCMLFLFRLAEKKDSYYDYWYMVSHSLLILMFFNVLNDLSAFLTIIIRGMNG